MHNDKFTLEVCIDSVESAIAAQKGGAQRVELCDNLIEGGTTPSLGMIQQVQAACDLDIMVMIRPRGGDFLYSDHEYEVMKRNILAAKGLGVKGVVFGLLTPDGAIDEERTAELLHLARPMEVTFHRAFDMVQDPLEALDLLIELGVDRLLTSGQEATAFEGRALIQQLHERANGRISIMPGAGIRPHNIAQIVAETGVNECHGSGSSSIPSAMRYRNQRISMGAPGMPEYERKVTDENIIREMRERLSV